MKALAFIDEEGVFGHHIQCHREVIGIVVQVDEAVVKKEAGVALSPVRIVDGLASLDVDNRIDDEALSLVTVCPRCFTRPLMIQHVCVRDKSICFVAVDRNAEDAAGNKQTHLLVLLERELRVLGDFLTNEIVILLHIVYFVLDLLHHVRVH